jgi:hypothetical protein
MICSKPWNISEARLKTADWAQLIESMYVALEDNKNSGMKTHDPRRDRTLDPIMLVAE